MSRPALLSCGLAVALLSPPAAAAPDWRQSRHDAGNSAAIELAAPASAEPRSWSFDGSGRVWGYQPGMTVWSSPALAEVDGVALIAVGSYDHDLYCLDAATGALRWKLSAGGPIYEAPTFAAGDHGVTLYATATDRLVYALDASTGRQRWVHAVHDYAPTLGGARLSSPVVGAIGDRAVVFVGYWVWDSTLAHNFQDGGVTALDAATGHPLWRIRLGDNQMTAPLHAVVDGRDWLFIGSYSGTLYGLDAATGEVRWHVAELDAVRSPPALVDTAAGTLLVAASMYGTVRGRDPATGAERWHYKTGDRITGAPAIDRDAGQALVLIGSYDRHLYALDAATGALRWRAAARGGVYASAAIAATAKPPVALVSAWDDAVHGVALADGSSAYVLYTGAPLWNVSGMDDSNWSSPVAARIRGTWVGFVASYDGTLRALLLDDADTLAPPRRSNRAFWLSFPIVLLPFAGLALWLTRRDRRRRPAGDGRATSRE